MSALVWFFFRKLSRRRMRLPVNQINAEWDFTLTESTQSETPCQPSQCRVFVIRRYLQRFHHSALTQLTWSLTPYWLSQCGVSYSVDSIGREWDSTLFETQPNDKSFEYVNPFENKIERLKCLFLSFIGLICGENQNKKTLQVYLKVGYISRRDISGLLSSMRKELRIFFINTRCTGYVYFTALDRTEPVKLLWPGWRAWTTWRTSITSSSSK